MVASLPLHCLRDPAKQLTQECERKNTNREH